MKHNLTLLAKTFAGMFYSRTLLISFRKKFQITISEGLLVYKTRIRLKQHFNKRFSLQRRKHKSRKTIKKRTQDKKETFWSIVKAMLSANCLLMMLKAEKCRKGEFLLVTVSGLKFSIGNAVLLEKKLQKRNREGTVWSHEVNLLASFLVHPARYLWKILSNSFCKFNLSSP